MKQKKTGKKGQIFSLDFILAVSLLVLSIGLAINYFEVTSLNASEAAHRQEMRLIAKTASDILVTDPSIVCDLNTILEQVAGSLPNCIRKTLETTKNGDPITKTMLGIPSNFDAQLTNVNGEPVTFPAEFSSPPPTTETDFVSMDRFVAVITSNDINLTKTRLRNCQKNGEGSANCPLKQSTIRLKVWKK